MKQVLASTADVATAWATQSQETAKAGNVSFKGRFYYSYGTLVGVLGKGGKYALVTSVKYSDSTSRQCGEMVAAAKKAGIPAFRVPSLSMLERDPGAHEINLQQYAERIEEACHSIGKAVRWDTALRWRSEAMTLIATAYLYARVAGHRWTFKGTNPMTVAGKDHEIGM